MASKSALHQHIANKPADQDMNSSSSHFCNKVGFFNQFLSIEIEEDLLPYIKLLEELFYGLLIKDINAII